MAQPDPQFVHSVQAALAYWQRRLEDAPPHELDAERHNLYRAIQFGLAHHDTQTTAAEAATRAFSFAHDQGHWQEWLRVMEQASPVCARLEAPAQFWFLTRLGNLRRLTRDLNGALRAHREALQLACATADLYLVAQAHYQMGRALRGARRHAEALEHLDTVEELIGRQEGEGADALAAFLHNAQGRVAHDQGRLADAQAHLERAVAIRRRMAQRVLLADDLLDLGYVHVDASEHDAALACFMEALAHLEGTDNRLRRLQVLHSIGVLHFAQGAYARAERFFREMDMRFLMETGNLRQQAMALVSLGNAMLYQGRHAEASQTLHESVALWRQLEDQEELANAIGSEGEALAGLGEREEARKMFDEALTVLANSPETARTRRLAVLFQTELEKVMAHVDE